MPMTDIDLNWCLLRLRNLGDQFAILLGPSLWLLFLRRWKKTTSCAPFGSDAAHLYLELIITGYPTLQNSVFRLARCFLSLVVVSSTGNVKKFKTRATVCFDISQNAGPNKIIFRKAAQSYSLPKKMLRTRYEVATKSPCWFVRGGVRARPLDTLNSGSGGPGFKPPPRRSP